MTREIRSRSFRRLRKRLVQINATERYNATALELTRSRASFELTTP